MRLATTVGLVAWLGIGSAADAGAAHAPAPETCTSVDATCARALCDGVEAGCTVCRHINVYACTSSPLGSACLVELGVCGCRSDSDCAEGECEVASSACVDAPSTGESGESGTSSGSVWTPGARDGRPDAAQAGATGSSVQVEAGAADGAGEAGGGAVAGEVGVGASADAGGGPAVDGDGRLGWTAQGGGGCSASRATPVTRGLWLMGLCVALATLRRRRRLRADSHHSHARGVVAWSASALASLSPVVARAQASERGFALDRFEPSERGSRWFALDSLDMRGVARPAVGLVGAWSRNPLVVRDAGGAVRTSVVEHQLVTHAGASLVLENRYRVGGNLPIGAYQSGDAATTADASLPAPSTTALGDARLAGDVRVVGAYGGPVTGALGVELRAPTGSREAYMSDRVFSATPRALVAGRVGLLVYAARLGVHIRPIGPSFGGSDPGSRVVLGAACGVQLAHETIHLGAELFGSTPVLGADGAFGARHTPLEILLGGRARVLEELVVGLGVGPGLTRGYGAPDVRGLASLEWAPGVSAGAEARPARTEPATSPPRPPSPSRTIESRASVVVPPQDRDGDGIADAEDACPDVPGALTYDPRTTGCPVAVVDGTAIRIRDQVRFRPGSAVLDPVSDPVLSSVRDVLEAHPEISRVRVEGHTDALGVALVNAKLSSARAAAVVSWLRARGISGERLEARGLGAERPITTNETEEGRRKNRRVEFHIAEREEVRR